MLKIGSISTNEDGTKTIYVDYDDKTKKVICTLFKWKNLTQKRLLKLTGNKKCQKNKNKSG